VAPRRGLEGRDHCRNIANHEDFTGIDIEHLRRIDPAVGAGNNHHLRFLTVAQACPALAIGGPTVPAEAAVSRDQAIE
jgi:hypothetical protein